MFSLCGYETLFLHFKMLKLNEVLASYSSSSPFIHSLLFNHFSSGIFLLFYEESLEFHHNLRIILKILLFRETYIPPHLFLEILINMSPFHSLRLFNHIIYLYISLQQCVLLDLFTVPLPYGNLSSPTYIQLNLCSSDFNVVK